eukprot:5482320-Pleurochrysis_carterae.AAC.1
MYAIAAEFYKSVPPAVRGQGTFTFSLRMEFDDLPPGLPESLQDLNLPLRCQTLNEALSETPRPVSKQYDHEPTRLPSGPLDQHERNHPYRITSESSLREVIFRHLTFRERLRELYDPE